MLTKLWIDQYSPVSVDDVIFANEQDKNEFVGYVKTKSIPNLLFIGIQGTGKSSLSQALVNDLGIDSADVLKINCSDEKIDALRDKVKTFAFTMPVGAFKVVRLEEMDYLSLEGQGLLRDLIQSTSQSCRFIATANYQNKIMPAVLSRFQVHTFSVPDRDAVLLRMADILVRENITFEVDDLEKIVAAGYPDIRKTLHLLESSSKTGALVIKGAATAQDWKLQLLPYLEQGDFKAARKMVCEGASKEELIDVYRFLYDNLHRVKKLANKLDQAVVLLAQYQYQHAFVSDPEIQIAALLIELGML